MSNNFNDISYEKHEKTYSKHTFKKSRMTDKNTVDWWRHERMYNTLNSILNFYKNKKWLTVGDGNYGHGAKYINTMGGDALATDLSMELLNKAKDIGYIDSCQKANAEHLPFKDNEFDFSFCKESYHHFPRPMIALYEMLRVSKEGIVLIEPNDAFSGCNIIRLTLREIKKLFGKKVQRHSYELVGNYVYTISRREIEKVALGLNYKCVAFKGINDHYIEGGEEELFSDNGPIRKKIERTIKRQNLFCRLGLTDYALLTTVIFKKKPEEKLLEKMIKGEFEIIHLPDNPYI